MRKIVLRKVESIVDLDGTLLHTSVKEKIMPFIEKLDELEAERSRHDLASASTGSRRRTRSGTNLEVTGGEREREVAQLFISFADLLKMHSMCAKKHASRAADDGQAQVEEQSALLLLLLDGHAHEKQLSLSFLSYPMIRRCSGSRAVKRFSGS